MSRVSAGFRASVRAGRSSEASDRESLCALGTQAIPSLGEVERLKLANGLQVLCVRDASVPAVAVQTWFRVGSRDELPGQTGLAHLFEHLSFKATQTYPEGVFSRVLEQAGARDVNAWTWNDQTVYIQTVPKTALDLVFRLESDRMVHLALTQAQLDAEREVVLNERSLTTEDDPMGRIGEALCSAAFTGHPYRWPVIGWRRDIEEMSLQACTDFYRQFYAPNNALLVLVGDLDREPLLKQLETWYGPLQAQPVHRPTCPEELEQSEQRLVPLTLQLEDPVLSLAYKVPGLSHPDRPALSLLELLLFQGRTGRLYRALVVPGIASSADGMVPALSSTSLFEISASLRQGHSLEEAQGIILDMLETLRQEGISDAELERVKRRFEVEAFTELRDLTGKANFLGAWELATGDYMNGLRHLEAVQAVTSADIQAVLSRYFRPEQLTAVQASPSLSAADSDPGPEPEAADDLEPEAPQDGEQEEGVLARADSDTFAQLDAVASRPELSIPVLSLEALHSPWPTSDLPLPEHSRLLVVEEHRLPLVHLQLLIPGGMGLEEPDQEGLASFMAELLQRGTRQRARTLFENEVEGLGATLDIVAEVDHLLVIASGHSRDFERLLGLLEEALTVPAFLDSELELLRGETLAALRESRNDDRGLMDTWFTRLLFSSHPYGRSSLGTRRCVSAFTPEAVRGAWQRMVHGAHVLAGAAGDITPERARLGFERLLGALPVASLPTGERPVVTPPLPPYTQAGIMTLIDKPERTQHQLSIGHRSVPAQDPRSPFLKLANFTFGGPCSTTRLMLEVREKRGWSYGANSRFDGYRVGGCFSAWVFPAQPVSLPCLSLVLKLIGQLKAEGLTQAELEFSRRAMLNSAAFEEDTPERLLRNLLIRTWHARDRGQLLRALAEAQLEQVNEALAQTVVPENLMGVMVCTADEVAPALEQSGLFQQVRVIPYDADEADWT